MGPGTIFHRAFDEADPEISNNPGNVKVLVDNHDNSVFCAYDIFPLINLFALAFS